MPRKNTDHVGNEEQYRKEFRTIFSETGHRTLNALLIVSGGTTISFLAFLGNAVKDADIAGRIGLEATKGFIFFNAAIRRECSLLHCGTRYYVVGPAKPLQPA